MYALNTQRTTWPDMVENWTTYLLHLVYQYIYAKEVLFCCCFIFELQRLIISREQKEVGLWRIWQCCHTCPPILGHWYRLLDTKWQHTWTCFCDFQTSPFFSQIGWIIKQKQTNKKTTHTNFYVCNFYSIQIARPRDASSVPL